MRTLCMGERDGGSNMNAVIDSLLSHRAIRSFRPDPIEDEVVDAITEAGTRAATNFQPYSVIHGPILPQFSISSRQHLCLGKLACP